MHPKALTGRRGARSVYNFGRILTDRIDSQSARNWKTAGLWPAILFWTQARAIVPGKRPGARSGMARQRTCEIHDPDCWTHLPALSAGDRTRRRFHLAPVPLDVDQLDRAAHPSFERTGNGSCKAGVAPTTRLANLFDEGTEPGEKPCFSSPADADMDTVASSSGRTGHKRTRRVSESRSAACLVSRQINRTSWTLFFAICFAWRITPGRSVCSP
jgi:hypothetical protein